jgi:sugar/nucleoside kinase (ribokinase family)
MGQSAVLRRAIEFATCVAALSVTKIGVVNALPTRAEADRLLDQTFLRERR